MAIPARGLLNREKKKKKKVWQRPPPPSPPRAARSEKNKKIKKITRRIHMSRRYASRRYAGGLGPSRIRTRIPTTRQLGQWVSLRKTLRFRVRLQLSQSRCLSLLLAMSGRVFLFLPPRGHEPPPTLRDRLNPNLSLYRHRFPIPRYAKWTDCVQSDIRAIGITGDWKTTALETEIWVETVTEGGRRFMATWRKAEVDAARYRQEKREAIRLGKLLSHTEA